MSATGFAFGPFQVDPQHRHIYRDGSRVPVSRRHIDVLLALLAAPGQVVTRDQLITAVWRGTAVGENSLDKAVSALRRAIGTEWIATERAGGYSFVGAVNSVAQPATDDAIEALLAPHRAWIEGRAALETLDGGQIHHARAVFEQVLAVSPDQAPAHVGLANARAFEYEMTRADREPDLPALADAERHARAACRLDLHYGEAWATLGFVLDRLGRGDDAKAALRRAVTLEPDHWRHHLRLAYASWGEERLRAAHRALMLMPGFPMAHWLVATVHVARQAFFDAARELATGLATPQADAAGAARFGAVGLHWLSGLLELRGDEDELALDAFRRELAGEQSGRLYARECCANTHYAIGALHLRRGHVAAAVEAFDRALGLLPQHPLALVCRAAALAGRDTPRRLTASLDLLDVAGRAASSEAALARAALLALQGRHGEAAEGLGRALDAAPPGAFAWPLPIEPILHVAAHPEPWAPVLARLRSRAA